MSHTPPPWFIGKTIADGSICVVGDGDSVVCEFPGRSGASVMADATLISASHLMLELVSNLASLQEGLEHGNSESEEAATVLARHARVVFSYATGEKHGEQA